MSKFHLVDECTYVSDYEWRGLSHFSFSSTLTLAVSFKVLMFTEK